MKNILIIDDDPEIVELSKTRLEASGYQVMTATDGEEGKRKAILKMPDLIIVDIKMPNVDGYSFVRSLRRDFEKSIPIIVLTAYANMKDLFAVEGIENYIVKPFKAEDLIERVNKCLALSAKQA